MKTNILSILLFISVSVAGQVKFDQYFNDKVLRFDFMFSGNNRMTTVYGVGMKEEPFWAGSNTNLIDPLGYGNFRYEVFDEASGLLIYSRGFSSLYQEWQTTTEARTISRCFYEVATMPFPKNRIKLVISERKKDGSFSGLYETKIDPADYFIRREKPHEVSTSEIYRGGDPSKSVDIAFIAEGYKADEMEKFHADVQRLSNALFAEKPFTDYRKRFNIWAVDAVSQDSGTDVPGEGIYVNTVLNSSFYTFDLDRYLTTQDIKAVNDYAAAVPHDAIIVLINSTRYGGGGVYNYYSGTTAGNILSQKVFIHEFGHGFAGLADEYYSSSVAYDEFYPLDAEPWEPNITTMIDFPSKWEKDLAPGIPVPTPAEEKYMNVTGVFEGGGYSAKGIFRPEIDCRMKSNGEKGYCSVCRNAIKDMIEYYIK
ncbi:MAG: peptidase M64 [Bacteroidales bacterium]|nr:peptidase M64 [Bacteroidales bacterium]